MSVPEIIKADLKDLERVKGVLKLGFGFRCITKMGFSRLSQLLKKF